MCMYRSLWFRESVFSQISNRWYYMCFFNINPQDASCLFNFCPLPPSSLSLFLILSLSLSLACLTWPSFVWEFKKEHDWLSRWLAVDKDHDISFARIWSSYYDTQLKRERNVTKVVIKSASFSTRIEIEKLSTRCLTALLLLLLLSLLLLSSSSSSLLLLLLLLILLKCCTMRSSTEVNQS